MRTRSTEVARAARGEAAVFDHLELRKAHSDTLLPVLSTTAAPRLSFERAFRLPRRLPEGEEEGAAEAERQASAAAVAAALETRVGLELLSLARNKLNGESVLASLASLLMNPLCALRVLRLAKNSWQVDAWRPMADALRANCSLTTLSADENGLGVTGTCMLVEGLRANAALRHLALRGNAMRDEGALAVADWLPDSALRTVFVDLNKIGNEGAGALLRAVTPSPLITKLSIASNHIGDAGMVHVRAMLEANTTLTHLDIGCNALLTDVGVQAVCDGLVRNGTLKTLIWNCAMQLGATGDSEASCAAIEAMLGENKGLETLDLKSNMICNKGAARLAAGLRKNSTLQVLVLRNNRLTDPGVLEFAQALGENETLLELDLIDNPFSYEGIQHMHDMCALRNQPVFEEGAMPLPLLEIALRSAHHALPPHFLAETDASELPEDLLALLRTPSRRCMVCKKLFYAQGLPKLCLFTFKKFILDSVCCWEDMLSLARSGDLPLLIPVTHMPLDVICELYPKFVREE